MSLNAELGSKGNGWLLSAGISQLQPIIAVKINNNGHPLWLGTVAGTVHMVFYNILTIIV